MGGNDAVKDNFTLRNGTAYVDFSGGVAGIHITTRGSDWYWAVTAIMMTSTIVFVGLSTTKPRTERIFHYITAAITMVASIAYFSMASNIGWSPTTVEFIRSDPVVAGTVRQIFYVRYIDWVITTPLLLMDLLLTAGIPWPTLLFTILIDEIMIITGLVGALVPSTYKFGYFTFGCLALLWIGWVLIMEARKHANVIGKDVGRVYLLCGTWTFFLWTLYPIAWGLAEGGNVIAPDSEAVFYGILDICAKPIFGSLLLWGHRNIDPARLGLNTRDYLADPISSTRGEKRDVVGNGHNNGISTHNNGVATHNNGVATHDTNPTTVTAGQPALPMVDNTTRV